MTAEPDTTPEPTPPEPPPPPVNVFQAVARVMAELPGIGKDDHAAPEQGAYAYRGIESITRHAQQLFGKYGVVFVLEETGYIVDPITVNGKPWTDTTLTCVYHVYGPGGGEDRVDVGPLHVVGRDNSDKGANKCRTQAFKYALLQLLCIGDGKDDADSGSPEGDAKTKDLTPEQKAEQAAKDERAKFRHERLGKFTPAQRDAFRAWSDKNELPRVTGAWTDEQLEMAIEQADKIEAETPPPDAHDAANAAHEQDQDAEKGNLDVPKRNDPDGVPPDVHDDADAPPPVGATDGAQDPPAAPQAADKPAERAVLTFDPSKLPTGRTPSDDLLWANEAPPGVMDEVVKGVKDLKADELLSVMKALDLSANSLNEATKRARIVARRVRQRMERMAEDLS